MQPHNPMLDTYRKLKREVVDLASPLLAKSYLISENEKDSPALSRAKTEWSSIPRLLEDIDTTLAELGERIFQISTESRLTEDARAQDISAAATLARATIKSKADDVQRRTSLILDKLRVAAYPARPQPADVTQEARLAGIKSDLRMVWDPVTGEDNQLVKAMVDSLARAIGDGDALSVWLLASSHWPEDYLSSRGSGRYVALWASEVASILDELSPADLAQARHLYRSLADGRDGLPLLGVLFAQLDRIVDDLANWRPSAFSPTPWSRVS